MYFAAGGVGGEVGERAGPELLLCCRKLYRGAWGSLLLYANLHSACVGVRASVWLARLCVLPLTLSLLCTSRRSQLPCVPPAWGSIRVFTAPLSTRE